MSDQAYYISHKEVLGLRNKIKELEAQVKKKLHCVTCGADHYDDGFHTKCPFCIVKKLEGQLKALQTRIHDNQKIGEIRVDAALKGEGDE